jgi:hypothetical protein
MNLKKYTKAELISQIKGFKNNPNAQSKLLDYLNIIKSLILKFTFLALIIKVFKQFKVIRRLWLIINTIVMSIFGISMMDLYGLSIFSALFAEISQITGNIINYLSNTKFYNYLIGWLGYKVEMPTKIEPMRTIQPKASEIEERITRNPKISSWFEKEQEIIEENSPFYKNKYFIYGTFLLISGLTYYYFGDEIKLLTVSTWEWLRGRRPDDNPPGNPGNPPINPQGGGPSSESTRMNPIATFFGLNKNKNKSTILEELMNPEESSMYPEGSDAIEVPNSSSSNPYFKEPPVAGPSNLTSPSLESLNNKAKEGWEIERLSSPTSSSSSSSSTSTVKPDNLPPSTVNSLEKIISRMDEAFNKDGKVKPFLGNPNIVKNLSEENWTSFVNPGIKNRMDLIETIFNIESEVTREEGIKMADELKIIIDSFEALLFKDSKEGEVRLEGPATGGSLK